MRKVKIKFLLGISVFFMSVTASALDTPNLSVSLSGDEVSLSWALKQADMGSSLSFSAALQDSAAYYLAITAKNDWDASTSSNAKPVPVKGKKSSNAGPSNIEDVYSCGAEPYPFDDTDSNNAKPVLAADTDSSNVSPVLAEGTDSSDDEYAPVTIEDTDSSNIEPVLAEDIDFSDDESVPVEVTDSSDDEYVPVEETDSRNFRFVYVRVKDSSNTELVSVEDLELSNDELVSVEDTESNSDELVSVEDLELSNDELVSVEDTESSNDEYVSDEDTELSNDEYVSDEDTELSNDEYVSVEDTELSDDEYVSVEDTELSNDEYVSNEDTELSDEEYVFDEDTELSDEEYASDEDTDYSDVEYDLAEETDYSIEDMLVDDSFNFSTTRDVYIYVATPFTNVVVTILDKSPEETGEGSSLTNTTEPKELLKFITDEFGIYEVANISIPAYLDTLILSTEMIGLPNYISAVIANNSIVVDYGDTETFLTAEVKTAPENIMTRVFSFFESVHFFDLISPASAYAQEPFNDYYYLGSGEGDWDANGVPNYLEAERDQVSASLLYNINQSLPERQRLPNHHPEYLYDAVGNDLQSNVLLDEEAEVFVTFVHEGAGYKNVLGYYYYGVNGISEPATVQDVENRTIIFPNVSYTGSGGGLSSGDKVKLEGPNPDGSFPAGTTIGWFVLANGYQSGPQTVTPGNLTVYSDKLLNVETPPDPDPENIRQHVVLLYDSTEELFVLGFEDIRRDSSGCDQDFNDAMFFITSNPATAIDISDVAEIETASALDLDGDGIPNSEDDYDNDATKAFNNTSNGTLAYEDLWPRKGDYDFNDLVVEYSINRVTNASNYVVEINANFTIRAIGAWYRNAFAVELPVDPGVIQLVSGTHYSPTTTIFSYEENGLEAGQEGLLTNSDSLYEDDKAVVIVTEDSTEFLNPGGNGLINTRIWTSYIEPKTISMTITLTPDSMLDLADVGSPPWNPFIVVNVTNINNHPNYESEIFRRAKEVHLPDYTPTNKADWGMHFGAGDDTNIPPHHPGGPRHYKSINNLPWALHIPERFEYPIEDIDVSNVHLKFINWAETRGAENKDWYLDVNGYRNSQHMYTRP